VEGGGVIDVTQDVIKAVGAYQEINDTTPLRVALAVGATSVLPGEPLWLQLVGAPSSGKSEAISMLSAAVDGRIADVSLPGLLGWTGGAKGRPTGLLARIGDGDRLVTITDFSTILADSDRGRRAALFSFLRVMYDGYVIREIGSAPQPLEWRGRVTIISGVTPQIDAFSAHADALGPRWLYCRVPDLTAEQRKRAGATARQRINGKRELREYAQAAAAAAVQYARERVMDVEINDVDGDWLDDAADVATLVRSDVPRDGYGAREINGPVTREEPPRMAIMLAQLFRGLVALGVTNRVTRHITVRCALDSTPLTRRRALAALSTGEVLNTSGVAAAARLDRKVARFALEELEALGFVSSSRAPRFLDERARAEEEADEEDPRHRRLTRNWMVAGDYGKTAVKLLEEVGRCVESIHTSPPSTVPPGYGSAHLDLQSGPGITRAAGGDR
jgi:hypothetical protein